MKNLPNLIWRHATIAGLLLAMPLLANAQPGFCGMPERHGPPPGGEMLPAYLPGLNLSDAQFDWVFDILHAQAPTLRQKHKALGKLEGELHTLTAAPDYSEAKVKSLADALGKAMIDVTLVRAQTDRQIYDILTPEQRKQLHERTGGPRPLAEEPPRGHGGDGRMPPPRC